jgi:HK97 family phage major capsid protein
MIWGLPVVQTTAKTAGTVLAGDFASYCFVARRQGVLVEWGWNSDDFSKFKKTVRATERMTLVVKRAGAFGLLTL